MFRKLIFNLAIPAVLKLIQSSIKDEDVKTFILALFILLQNLIEVLTDDDKDNTAQIKEVLRQQLPEFAKQLQQFLITKILD